MCQFLYFHKQENEYISDKNRWKGDLCGIRVSSFIIMLHHLFLSDSNFTFDIFIILSCLVIEDQHVWTQKKSNSCGVWFIMLDANHLNHILLHCIKYLDVYFQVVQGYSSSSCSQIDTGLSKAIRLPDVNSLIKRYCPFNSTNHLCCSNPFSLSGLSPWWRQMEGTSCKSRQSGPISLQQRVCLPM